MTNQKSEIGGPLKLLVRSSFAVFISVLLVKILSYVYKIIVARYYGAEVYGLLALALVVVGWAAVLAELGLGAGFLRYFSFYRGKKKERNILYFVKFFSKFLFLTGLSLGILLFLFSDIIAEKIFSNPQLSIFLKLLSFTIPLSSLSSVFSGLMQSYEKIGWLSFLRVVNFFIRVVAIIILTYIGTNAINVPVSYLPVAIITLLFPYLFCRISLRNLFILKPKKDKKAIKEIIRYSFPLIFSGIILSLLYQSDSFMIGIFKAAEDVGFYNAAIPIAVLLIIPMDLFGQLFFPLVAKEYARGNMRIVEQLSKQVGKWTYMLSLPFFILFMLFPGVFIRLLFGTEYLFAINALRFLSIGAMFTLVFEGSKKLVLISGKSALVFNSTLTVLLFNILLNLILIPAYGINGAAFSTMLSFIALSLIFAYFSWKFFKIVPLRRKMVRVSLIAIVLAVLMLLIREFVVMDTFNLVIIGILFVSIYFILVIITGCLDKNDELILESVKNKLFKKKHAIEGLVSKQEDL